MSLSSDRVTNARQRTMLCLGVAAAAFCHAGGLAALDGAGHVKPGATALGLRGLGRFRNRADNSGGAAGDITAEVELGVFQFKNSATTDAIAAGDIGKPCYIVDDETVAKTDGGSTRSVAGIIVDLDAEGVWVDFVSGGLSSAGGKVFITFPAMSNKAADAAIVRRASPVKGTITKIWSVLNAALTTGDATLTGKIGATGITGGVVTVTQAGSAAGDVDSAAPTAANAVLPGDVISFTGGGASTATSTSEVLIEITL